MHNVAHVIISRVSHFIDNISKWKFIEIIEIIFCASALLWDAWGQSQKFVMDEHVF